MRKRSLSSITLLVLFLFPVFVQAFSVERDLGVGQFYAVYRDADTGWRIEGSFSVSSDIEFFICDAGNYTKWTLDAGVVLYEHSVETSGKTFNFTIPYDAVWYVVFSNAQSQDASSLETELYYIDHSNNVQTQIAWKAQTTVISPLFIGLLVALPVACLVVVWMARRSEPFPAVDYEKILPKPD